MNPIIFRTVGFFLIAFCTAISNAQIGYQVSLLNSATGEPRANETVTCAVSITDIEGGIIYSGSQSATSNDFGVLSLSVGNANTFKNADWGKFPFFISVSVNGVLIGKSQILSVPVAEGLNPVSVSNIVGTWYGTYLNGHSTSQRYRLSLTYDGSAHYTQWEVIDGYYGDPTRDLSGSWELSSNNTILVSCGEYGGVFVYSPRLNALISGEYTFRK